MLLDGTEYHLVLSTPGTSEYTAATIREGTDVGFNSYAFRDGTAQRSSDSGTTWAAPYAFSPVDNQWYFTL